MNLCYTMHYNVFAWIFALMSISASNFDRINNADSKEKIKKNYEKFEDGQWVIWRRKSNVKQDNGKTKYKK